MSSQKLSLDFKGLVSAPGQLAAPTGSLTVATNVNFPAPGLVEKRRGVQTRANKFGGGGWKFISTKQLGSNLLYNTGNGTVASTLQYGDGTAVYTSLATPDSTNFSNTATERMRAAVSLKNHFLTFTRAPGRLESDYSFSWAGMPRSPGIYYGEGTSVLRPLAGRWLADGSAVAYRTVFGTVDADGVERVSAPSGRFVMANIATTSGYSAGLTAWTELRCLIPRKTDTTATAVTTSWFLRVYRSFQAVVATGEPNDELQLCYQANLTAGQITAGYVTVTDSCPESALGGYLYTNTVSGGDVGTSIVRATTTGLGLLVGNDRPPLAKEVATFADCVWWSNFTTLQRLQISLLAVGAAPALAVGDVLTIAGINFTGVAGVPASTLQFKVELGLASTALNIRQTAHNIVEAVNAEATQTLVTASYVGSDASPGTIGAMLFEARRSDAAAFSIGTSGSVTPFLPQMGTSTSSKDTWSNGIAISKPFQGDAVPPCNYVRVGRNDSNILATIPLGDALFIFTDDGIFWARGTSPANFQLDAFDSTFRLLSREAAVSCGDAIYAWGAEGIARITNGGVEYVDLAVRNYVQGATSIFKGPTNGIPLSTFTARVFAVAYRVQRRVLFYFPLSASGGSYGCSAALSYDIPTNSWSTYEYGSAVTNGKSCGAVRFSDELLHLGEWSGGSDTYLYVERSAWAAADYADVDSTGAARAITSTLTWRSSTPNPAGLCHWQETQLYWSNEELPQVTKPLPSAATLSLTTEAGTTQSASITSITTQQTRVMCAPEVGLATRQVVTLTHTATEYFGLSGFALIYSPISNFTTR